VNTKIVAFIEAVLFSNIGVPVATCPSERILESKEPLSLPKKLFSLLKELFNNLNFSHEMGLLKNKKQQATT
jgi:hypothetical protein